jgi:hypothetical protein
LLIWKNGRKDVERAKTSIKQFPDWNLNGEKNDSRATFVLIIELRAVIFIQYSKYKVQAPRVVTRL